MDTAEHRLKELQNYGKSKYEKDSVKTREYPYGSKIRFWAALVLFLLFYVLNQKDISILGLTGEKIYETVCENAKGFDFIKDFPYTLND